MNFKFGFKKIFFSLILCFFVSVIFAQENENTTTITIKNQWIDRFVSLFMPEGSAVPEWINTDIYIRYITK